MLVEAIEEGRIVKVSELYAKREGLPIIRRPHMGQIDEHHTPLSPKVTPQLKIGERRHIHDAPKVHDNWQKQQVVSELIENFHWRIRIERKRKGLSRKQLAKQINEPEANLMEIESGNLPRNDFVLINKIQQALNINLRKDKKNYSQSVQDLMQSTRKPLIEQQREYLRMKKTKGDSISGSEIEILEDEI